MPRSTVTTGPRAVLRYPKGDDALVVYAQKAHDSLLGDTRVPNANPDLHVFQDHIDAYRQAIPPAKRKEPGAANQRKARRAKVVEDLHHLVDDVRAVAETIANPADAVAFIEGLGFAVKRKGRTLTLPLRARYGDLSGTVILSARAIAQVATYYWQYSLDGKTWIDAGDTLKASMEITGLTAAQMYHFRFRARARTRETDWSQVVQLNVH